VGVVTAAVTGVMRRVVGYQPTADDQVLRVGDRDVRGLPGVVVVGEAVRQTIDSVLVPELRVVVGRGSLVEEAWSRLLRRRQLCDVPVQPGAQDGIGGQRAAVSRRSGAVVSLVSPTEAA